MGKTMKLLDHGYVTVVDKMGDDDAVVAAARLSYEPGALEEPRTREQQRNLIRHLMRHWHSSPSEMVELKLQIKLPLFVQAQLIRHRTANVNQLSGRYSEMDQGYYIPEVERMHRQSRTNRQGSAPELVDNPIGCRGDIQQATEEANLTYVRLLDEGLSRELARLVLPQNTYTVLVWKMDLHNLLHFLRLRLDEHAQWEIRQYAKAIADVIREWLPLTWEAFEDYRLNAMSLSGPEVECLRAMLAGEKVPLALLGKREQREFASKLGRLGVPGDDAQGDLQRALMAQAGTNPSPIPKPVMVSKQGPTVETGPYYAYHQRYGQPYGTKTVKGAKLCIELHLPVGEELCDALVKIAGTPVPKEDIECRDGRIHVRTQLVGAIVVDYCSRTLVTPCSA